MIRKQKEHEAMEEYRKRLLLEQHEKEEAAVCKNLLSVIAFQA